MLCGASAMEENVCGEGMYIFINIIFEGIPKSEVCGKFILL
jgi:hypothetical protein